MADNNRVAPIHIDSKFSLLSKTAIEGAKRIGAPHFRSQKIIDQENNKTRFIEENALEKADWIRYMGYPNDIKGQTAKAESPEQLMKDVINRATRYTREQTRYAPSRIENVINKMQSVRNGTGNLIQAAWDTETLELIDKNGMLQSVVMEYGFAYNAVGNKVFTGTDLLNPNTGERLVSSGLIGISEKYNKNLYDAMQEVLTKVQKGEQLSKRQQLVYDFVSRIGDQGTIINYGEGTNSSWANIEKLTTRARGEYMTPENYKNGLQILESIGARQYDENGINVEQMRMVKNMAYMASNDVDLIVGKNVMAFDIGHAARDVIRPGSAYEAYYQKLTGSNSFPQHVIHKTLDYDELRQIAGSAAIARADEAMYRHMPRLLERRGYGRQENWLKALGWDEFVSHSAAGDALDLLRIANWEGENGINPLSYIEDSAKNIVRRDAKFMAANTAEAEKLSLVGSLVQAQTAGNMKALEFNKFIVGTVTDSNGVVHYSSGRKWNPITQQWTEQEQFVPALWSKDVTYKITGAEVLDRNAIQNPLIGQNPVFVGDDIIHLQMQVYTGTNETLRYLERAQQVHDIYIPASHAEAFAHNFGIVKAATKNGGFHNTSFGRNQIKNTYLYGMEGDLQRIDPEGGPIEDIFVEINQRKIRDSAERSLNKYTQFTTKQAIRYRHLMDNGNFSGSVDPAEEIYNAIYEGASGADPNYTRLKNIAGNAQKEAIDLAEGFVFDEGFNASYLANINTIARSMEKGSLLEQLDAMIHQEAKALNIPGVSSEVYKTALRNAATVMRSKIEDNPRLMGLQFKEMDQRNMFYIPLEELTKAQRVGAVAKDAGRIATLGVHLDSVEQTMGAMVSIMKVPEYLRDNPADERNAILEVLSYVGNSKAGDYLVHIKDKDGQRQPIFLRDKINQMFGDIENPIDERNPKDIAQEFIELLRNVRSSKNQKYAGMQSTSYYETLSSALMHANAVDDTVVEDMRKSIVTTLTKYKERGSVYSTPTSMKDEVYKFLTEGVDTQTKFYSNWSPNTAKTAKAILHENQEAMRRYAGSFVDWVQRSGGEVAIANGAIQVHWAGSDVWQDMTERMLKLNTDVIGLSYFQVGKKGTWYSGSPVARFMNASRKRQKEFSMNEIYMGSRLELALDKFTSPKGSNIEEFNRRLALGEDPSKLMDRLFFGKINEEIYRGQLAGGNLTKDFQNYNTISLDPLLYHRDLEERIPIWKNQFKNNPAMRSRVSRLEAMVQKITGANGKKKMRPEEARQFMEDVSAMELFVGNDGILTMQPEQDYIHLTTSYKKSASGLQAGLGEFAFYGAANMDPGKSTATLASQGNYFINDLANEEIQKLKEEYGVRLSPRFMTKTQSTVARFQDKSGAILTNALQIPVLETNATVKEEILKRLEQFDTDTSFLQKTYGFGDNDPTNGLIVESRQRYTQRVRDVFAKRYNATEGGGLYNGMLTDALDTSWGTQIIELNGRDPIYPGYGTLNKKFADSVQFNMDNGDFHYGTGFFRKYDATVAEFDSRYGNSISDKIHAKNPSIVRLEFRTKQGEGLLSEEEVKRLIVQHDARLNGNKPREFADIVAEGKFDTYANELFDKVLVSRSIYETDHRKMLFDSEKHVGASTTAFLGDLFRDQDYLDRLIASAVRVREDGTTVDYINPLIGNSQIAQETIVSNMLHTPEFERLVKKAGTDWRGSVALRSNAYNAIADLDYYHPIFFGINSNHIQKLETDITREYLLGRGYKSEWISEKLIQENIDQAKGFFQRVLLNYRDSINQPLAEVTNGALAYGESVSARSKHKDVTALVENTVEFIRQNIFEASKNQTGEAVDALEQAAIIFDKFHALRDVDGHFISLAQAYNKELNSFILGDTPFSINRKAIEEGIGKIYNLEDWLDSMNEFRGLGRDGKFRPTMSTFQFLFDDTRSIKTLNITDREMSRFSARVWNQDISNAIEAGLQKDWQGKKIMSRYLAMAEARQEGLDKEIIGRELIDYMYRESAFASFKDNTFGRAALHREDGTGIKAGGAYVKEGTKALQEKDPYRIIKTQGLIDEAVQLAGVEDPYVSQEFADKLYAAGSLKSAGIFNNSSDRAAILEDLVTDWGKNKTGSDYFQVKNIGQHTLFTKSGMQSMANNPLSDLAKNTVWDMTNADIGLTSDVLGNQAYVAVSGTVPRQFEDIADMYAKNAPQSYLDRINRVQAEVRKAFNENPHGEAYALAVERYKDAISGLEDAMAREVSGKNEHSIMNQITAFRAPGSISSKVNVTDATRLGPDSKDFEALLGDKTFHGKSLKELAAGENPVNYMIISSKDLETMGFNEEYFKRIGITKEKWLERAKTEGVAGIGHRWPSVYWGSNMAVQVYVDDQVGAGIMRMDEITAAFMKADSDGDRAQLFMLGATQKNGRWFDELSLSMFNDLSDKEKQNIEKLIGAPIRDAERYLSGHSDMMLSQMYYYNKTIKTGLAAEKYAQTAYQKLIDKMQHVDISGDVFIPYSNQTLGKEDFQNTANAFLQVRDNLIDALDKTGDTTIRNDVIRLREATAGDEAFEVFRSMLDNHEGLRQKVWENLGDNRDAINQAFTKAYQLVDADTTYMQRIAKGGAGVIDNPFNAADFLRREGLNLLGSDGTSLLSAQESFALDMLREHTQEDFLTPKQMTSENAKMMEDLTRVTDLFGELFSGNMTTGQRRELSDLLMVHHRPLENRYVGYGMMKHFTNADGSINDRKIIDTTLDALSKVSGAIRDRANVGDADNKFTALMNSTASMVKMAKMHTDNVVFNTRVMSNITRGAMNLYDGTGKQLARELTDDQVQNIQQRILQESAGFMENAIGRAGKGGWGRNAIALAGSLLFTGFVGGNPSRPTQQQAEEQYYNQAPPQNSINLADPSLSPSGRKQPGYVININAQTQKDKDYASQVITQAVTRNFQNTNINVSMNVNQQPGNISGNEIADYLRQVL